MAEPTSVGVFLSSDVDLDVRLKVGGLYGRLPASHLTRDGRTELSVSFQLFSENQPLTTAISTTAALYQEGSVDWSETLFFPLKYRDLSAEAWLEIMVHDARDILRREVIGRAAFRMFDEKYSLRRGNQRMFLERTHGGSIAKEAASMKMSSQSLGDMGKIEARLKSYEQGEMPELDWLDKLTYRRIDEIQKAQRAAQFASGHLEIRVELPTFSAPVIFHEQTPLSSHNTKPQWDQLIWLIDSEVNLGLENPAERKHQKLTRSVARGVVDHDLKPNGEERRSLATAIALPPRPAAPPSAAKAMVGRRSTPRTVESTVNILFMVSSLEHLERRARERG